LRSLRLCGKLINGFPPAPKIKRECQAITLRGGCAPAFQILSRITHPPAPEYDSKMLNFYISFGGQVKQNVIFVSI